MSRDSADKIIHPQKKHLFSKHVHFVCLRGWKVKGRLESSPEIKEKKLPSSLDMTLALAQNSA